MSNSPAEPGAERILKATDSRAHASLGKSTTRTQVKLVFEGVASPNLRWIQLTFDNPLSP